MILLLYVIIESWWMWYISIHFPYFIIEIILTQTRSDILCLHLLLLLLFLWCLVVYTILQCVLILSLFDCVSFLAFFVVYRRRFVLLVAVLFVSQMEWSNYDYWLYWTVVSVSVEICLQPNTRNVAVSHLPVFFLWIALYRSSHEQHYFLTVYIFLGISIIRSWRE